MGALLLPLLGVALALILAPEVGEGASTLRGAPLPPSSPPLPLHHIAGIFEVTNFTEYAIHFNQALSREVSSSAAALVGHVRMEAISLQAWNNAHDRLTYICDACRHNNITVFFAVGSQDMLNTLSIVTRYVGIPIIGYNTDKDSSPIRVSPHFKLANHLCIH